jgi:hypothetical protein
MSVTYYAYTTNVSNYELGDNTYTTINSVDDTAYTISLANPFLFNGTNYSVMYLNSNGLINFTALTSSTSYNNNTSSYAGFYIFGVDLLTADLPYFIRYKEFSDTFVLIYNNYYFGRVTSPFQVKITLYLNNNIRSGDVVADFGNVSNSDRDSQFGVSFGTQDQDNIIQNVNFLNYTYNAPYVFTYPNSPNQDVTNIQSNYANKQFIVSYSRDPSCFNEGTKILTLNKHFEEEYIPIENLRKGDLVKSYKHGYRKIDLIGKNPMINNPERFNECMYKMTKTDDNGLIEDLIVTGGHSLLVDELSEIVRAKHKELNVWDGNVLKIDDKYLLIVCASDKFVKLENTNLYTYYHFILENNGNNDERFGVWSNGILTETPSKTQFTNHNYTLL